MSFDREKYKQFARQQIDGRRKNAALAVLIVVTITLAFSIPQRRLNNTWEELSRAAYSSTEDLLAYFSANKPSLSFTFILSFIATLISFITRIALDSFFLTYSRSPEPVSLKVFFEGFNKWGRGILAGLWQTLWYFIWTLGIMIIYIILLIPCIFLPVALTGIIDILSNLTIVLICALLIIKALEYSQLFYLVAEFPELGVRKALRISILITKGHRAELLVTILTFLPYYLLGVFTLGFAQVWYQPYLGMTYVNIYHALLKDALENGKINPEDLN